jgi:hypothetical protein
MLNCPKCKEIQTRWNASLRNIGYVYPNGTFYRRACEYMGIDPDNNPNYKCSECNDYHEQGI